MSKLTKCRGIGLNATVECMRSLLIRTQRLGLLEKNQNTEVGESDILVGIGRG